MYPTLRTREVRFSGRLALSGGSTDLGPRSVRERLAQPHRLFDEGLDTGFDRPVVFLAVGRQPAMNARHSASGLQPARQQPRRAKCRENSVSTNGTRASRFLACLGLLHRSSRIGRSWGGPGGGPEIGRTRPHARRCCANARFEAPHWNQRIRAGGRLKSPSRAPGAPRCVRWHGAPLAPPLLHPAAVSPLSPGAAMTRPSLAGPNLWTADK